MPLTDVRWTRPVKVRLQCGLEHTFTSIYDALDFLENEWPIRHGQHHQQAVKRCRRALNGIIPAEIAREAFVVACLEAGWSMLTSPLKPRDRVDVQVPWEVLHHR